MIGAGAQIRFRSLSTALISAALLCTIGSGASAVAQPAPGATPASEAPGGDSPGGPPRDPEPVYTAEQMRLPGMTRESLKAVPNFTGNLWVPDNVPSDERAYLKTLKLPPLKRDYLADARAAIADIRKGSTEPPSETCAFDGQPRLSWYPYPVQFMFTPGYVMILSHWFMRAAPVSGLDHPPELRDKNRIQEFQLHGHAAGVWQGDTLVIDTIATREDMDTFYGIPHDPDIHVVERYRLLSPDKLERRTTVESPTYFTKPWDIVTTYHRAPEISWATHFCLPAGQGEEAGAQ